MDFEDFKLKPLSEGLGFRKNKIDLTSKVDEINLPPPEEELTELDEFPTYKPKLFTPEVNVKLEETKQEPDIPKVLKTPVEVNSGPSFVALVFDFFVVTGLFLMASFALFLVTDLNLNVLISNLASDPMTQIMMAILFFSISMFYLVFARSIAFCTLGEWATDIKLGTTKQRQSILYPIRVFLRCAVMIITGIIPITLLGLLRKKDYLRIIVPLVKEELRSSVSSY